MLESSQHSASNILSAIRLVDKKSRGNRRRSSLTFLSKRGSSSRHCEIDDEEGKSEFFLKLLIESIEDSATFVIASITSLVAWSAVCAYFATWLREQAASDPGGPAEHWIEDIENCRYAISVVGTLFVFTLVFRFNACYDRWWESRVFWGDIISRSLELAMMNRRWVANENLADRMSRFIILFSYASKSLLRGKSLSEEGEDGPALIQRGLLTPEELSDMHSNPCWQPHYCLEMIRAILVEVHQVPGGKGLALDENNKAHGQMFRCFDNSIRDLTNLVGDCIRVRSSGLPASYDAIVETSFFTFFILAALVWAMSAGWMILLIIFCASFIVALLIVMGTKLVDPFGYDKVDIPMEAFCATIECQINAIDERSKSGSIKTFARTSIPKTPRKLLKQSSFHIPKFEYRNNNFNDKSPHPIIIPV